MRGQLHVVQAGVVPFAEAWEGQRRIAASGVPTLLLLEHPPVFTIGRNGRAENVVDAHGIPVLRIDRGGDVTYHGPGQLVGYPIFSLRERRMGIRDHVERMERVLIGALAEVGVAAWRREGMVGVWTGTGKVASIGVRVSGGVTMHGFALNVCVDLTPFSYIHPCGVRACAMTSVSGELGRRVEVVEMADRVVRHVVQKYNFQSVIYENPLPVRGATG